MTRLVCCTAIALLVSVPTTSNAGAPPNRETESPREIAELRRIVTELTKRIEELERQIRGDEIPAPTVRYQQMSVLFANFPSRESAGERIAEIANDFVMRPRSRTKEWNEVRVSTLSEIESAPIQEAVSSLPIRVLSAIVEDKRGFHIVRVLER